MGPPDLDLALLTTISSLSLGPPALRLSQAVHEQIRQVSLALFTLKDLAQRYINGPVDCKLEIRGNGSLQMGWRPGPGYRGFS